MQQTFLDWLEDFVISIENPEIPDPTGPSENEWFNKGYITGCFETQTFIARKLRYALNAEHRRMLDAVLEGFNKSNETEILSGE
jgi:hypothetical protein